MNETPPTGLTHRPDGRYEGAADQAGKGMTTGQPMATMGLTTGRCLHVSPQIRGLQAIGRNFL